MKTRVGSLVLFVVFTTLGPALAAGEGDDHGSPGKAVVLYELNEEARITPTLHRIASSGLEGKARRGTPLCPEKLMAYAETFYVSFGITVQDASRCSVVAFGRSDLDLGTVPFRGTIGGDFYVVVNSDLTNLTDAPELVVMAGTFEGAIQVIEPDRVIIDILRDSTFTPGWVLPGFPGGVPPPAVFTGKFRLPFKLDHIAVYKKDNGQPVAVRSDERALGDPTVRVEVNFD